MSCSLLPGYSSVCISSNRWPGAHAFASGKKFDNIYVGWGHKYLSDPYRCGINDIIEFMHTVPQSLHPAKRSMAWSSWRQRTRHARRKLPSKQHKCRRQKKKRRLRRMARKIDIPVLCILFLDTVIKCILVVAVRVAKQDTQLEAVCTQVQRNALCRAYR